MTKQILLQTDNKVLKKQGTPSTIRRAIPLRGMWIDLNWRRTLRSQASCDLLVLDRKEQHESYIVPEVFQNYLIKVSDIHSYNTRYASNLNFHVPRVKSNYGKHTFKFAITKTWEEIPTKIKTLSYHKFKKEYKRILVNSQR